MSRNRRYEEDGDEEVGGFIKNPPKRKDKEDSMKEKRRMTSIGGLDALRNPEVKKQILGNDAPPATTQPKQTPAPPAKTIVKEETKVEKTQTATQTQVATEPCPRCGYLKSTKVTPAHGEPYRPLTCKGCKDKYSGPYVSEVTAKRLAGEKVEALSWHEWLLTQLDLTKFGEELHEAFEVKNRLESLVQTELRANGNLPPQIRASMEIKLREKKFPGETMTPKEGFGKWRRLQARLEAAKEVRPQLEKMVAEEAARNAPSATVATVTETPAPAKVAKTPRKRTVKATKTEK